MMVDMVVSGEISDNILPTQVDAVFSKAATRVLSFNRKWSTAQFISSE